MKTKCILLLNGKDVERAKTLGLSHVDEDTKWVTIWFDEDHIDRAVEDFDEHLGPCISITIGEYSYMVQDTIELRDFLNKKFDCIAC